MPDFKQTPGKESLHTPVLMQEVLDGLAVQASDVVVDATLGGAGHFSQLLSKLGADGLIVGIDADSEAVSRARAAYAADRRPDRPTTHLVNDNFRNLTRILDRLGVATVDKTFFDLGWSGYQIASPRGFSFQNNEPLLMNYGAESETAADIVNSATETELADIIFTYGEERFARKIAKEIVDARRRERILTTGQLVAAITAGVPRSYREGKSHPATKTFQALRIAANDELGALTEGLTAALARTSPGGRVAVISFHSLEDRIVKNFFRAALERGEGSLVEKKPIAPSRAEVLANRRARSAKLRIFERAAAFSFSSEPVLFPSYA